MLLKIIMKENYGADFVDMVTEPGPNKILADNSDKVIIEILKKELKFLCIITVQKLWQLWGISAAPAILLKKKSR